MGPLEMVVAGVFAFLEMSVKALDDDFQVADGDKSWAVPNSVNGLDYQTWAETHQYHVADQLTELLVE
ncbi:hypothetical protein AXG93_1998s1180 [Marchantia polymorpha subsp. ruderalis]|uniref:Phytocyanin domain-containing protein n=1 Tax=Marchantia polymorpha subsp. ruderalis TaxID=1480154 RepID=A0A176VLW9_MARPO|nr:hypothetical protein AXG93_1998s1180 [Marchantia polymorpha subsp. ruderalis]